MRIDQMLQTFAYGDAIGNDVIAIQKALKEEGYESRIYASEIDSRINCEDVFPSDEYENGDILLYHASTGCELNHLYSSFDTRKWIIFHNVTDPIFFMKDDPDSARRCENGINEITAMKEETEVCIADSSFNKSCLEDMGFTCPIEVVPILIDFDSYNEEANIELINKYKDDGYTNILFTGRVAPNKKHEDCIEAFYYYKKYINPKSRLFLVGGYVEEGNYYKRLKEYVSLLEVDDVIFTGHIPFKDILAYYELADVFLCMSEHEGFCVPLVEAMHFNVPIIAYNSTAIPETLNEGGLLLDNKDPCYVAEAINLVLEDEELRDNIKQNAQDRLKDFSNNIVKERLLSVINKYK